jgi:hypothetical protein
VTATGLRAVQHRVCRPGGRRIPAGALGGPGRRSRRQAPESRGTKLLQGLWAKDKYMSHLDADAIQQLERFFDFATVPANRDVIRQDEYGNFMVVLLSGNIAVDRVQPWGERCVWPRPGPATFWARCRCWTAASAFRPAPP